MAVRSPFRATLLYYLSPSKTIESEYNLLAKKTTRFSYIDDTKLSVIVANWLVERNTSVQQDQKKLPADNLPTKKVCI